MEGQLRGCPCLDALRTCRTHPTPQTTAILFSPPDHGSPHDRGAQTGLWPLEPSFEKHLTGGGVCFSGGHFVRREQKCWHPTPIPKRKKEKTLPSRSLLSFPFLEPPRTQLRLELVAWGRAGREPGSPWPHWGPEQPRARPGLEEQRLTLAGSRR